MRLAKTTFVPTKLRKYRTVHHKKNHSTWMCHKLNSCPCTNVDHFHSQLYDLWSWPIHVLFSTSQAHLIHFCNIPPAKVMETSKEEGKRFVQEPVLDEEGEDDEDAGEDSKKKGALNTSKRRVPGEGGSTQRSCQVEDCKFDMADAKPYHRRHKVCEFHAKAAAVLFAGSRQRFCQQCSRFHELSEFDEAKRSCRRRLAGHNQRRRKSSYDSH